MNLILFTNKNSKSEYYSKTECTSDEYELLGFKHSVPVIQNITMSKPMNRFILETDPSGEKYITIDGKKLKVIPHQKLPANTKLVLQKFKSPESQQNLNITKKIELPNKVSQNQVPLNVKIASNEIRTYSKLGNKPNILITSLTGTSPVIQKFIIKDMKKVNQPTAKKNNRGKISRDTSVQTEMSFCNTKEIGVQTEKIIDSVDTVDIMKFLQDDTALENCLLFECPSLNSPTMYLDIDVGSLSMPVVDNIQKEKAKKKFFMDLRMALTFDPNGNMPIHDAVLKNDLVNLKRFIVVLSARRSTIDVENQNGLTALQLAVINSSTLEVISLLLEKGADMALTDNDGLSVFHMAVECENNTALELLCKYALKKNVNLDLLNYEGQSPLMGCCINNYMQCAEILLKYGANPNLQDSKSGRTALFHAAENRHSQMVKLLLDNNADTKARNFFGTSPHDAMYEVEDIPQEIKELIFSVRKRKSGGDGPWPKRNKMLQTVKSYKKVDIQGKNTGLLQKNREKD